MLSAHFGSGFLASLSFFHKKRVLIGTLFYGTRDEAVLDLLHAHRVSPFVLCTSRLSLPLTNNTQLFVRQSAHRTRFSPSVRKSVRTLLEFSPLSLYILKNTLSGVVSKMERETRLSCSLAINGITCRKLNVSATSASARSRSNFATKLRFVRVLKPTLTIKNSTLTGAYFLWSERRGSNSRPLPWQGSVLPLNYSRNQ